MSECLLYYIKDGLTRWGRLMGGAAVGVRAHPCFLEVMLWLLGAEWLSQDWLCLGVFHVPPLMCILGVSH